MSARTLRIKVDASHVGDALKDFYGLPIRAPRGATLGFQLGFFENSTLDVLTDFTTIKIEIKPQGASETTTAHATKTITSGINTGLTLAQWKANSAAHVTTSFTATEMNAVPAGDKVLCVWGTTDAGIVKTWLSHPIEIIEDACG